MRRTLRLFAYAAAMLVVAVGVAALLKDEPGYEAGRSEISGKIVGLTEFQEHRDASDDGAEKVEEPQNDASGGKSESGRMEPPSGDVKTVSASAPFDTRPASIASDEAEKKSSAVAGDKESAKEKAPSSASPSLNKKEKSGGEKTVVAEENNAQVRERNAAVNSSKKEAEKSDDSRSASAAQSRAAEKDDRQQGNDSSAKEPSSESADSGTQYERVVTSARFSMQGSQIKLTLQGNAPMVGHYFLLGSPDRVVLDLAGNWQVSVPSVPSNRLIEAVRVGQHDDKTRIVFDMKTTGKVALVPLNRNALELRIQ